MVSHNAYKKLIVKTKSHQYPIYIMQDLFQYEFLRDLLGSARVFVVSDRNVQQYYLSPLINYLSNLEVNVKILEPGEEHKSLKAWTSILESLISHKYNRDTVLIALGGGVVGDIAGFAASCFQRGIKLIQIPTTLLAQVDSSVGGKTAINFCGEKNVVGSFYQPHGVFIDPNVLETLEEREYLAGLAEVLKYGLIMDKNFFQWLADHVQLILNRDPQAVIHIIENCCQMKATIVANDEKEQGQRALLNLGHTFAHALEAITDYSYFLHGEAVAIGLYCQAILANRLGYLAMNEVKKIKKCIEQFGLSTQVPSNINIPNLLKLMYRDKKVKNAQLRFVITKGIGQAVITSCDNPKLIMEVLEYASR